MPSSTWRNSPADPTNNDTTECRHGAVSLHELTQFLLAHRSTQSAQDLAEMLMREYLVCGKAQPCG